jgi:sugar lactone lactonase YvrE
MRWVKVSLVSAGLFVSMIAFATSAAAGSASPAPKAAVVVWSPASLVVDVVRGSATTATAAFTSSKKLPNVTMSALGAVAPFVTPSPASIASVSAGSAITISLAVAIPASTALGDYTGSVAVLSGKKPVANSLPLTIHVVAPSGHIYWAGAGVGAIGRADIDGSNVILMSILSPGTDAVGVAVNAQNIFWTDANNAAIGRANLDGSNPNPGFIALGGQSTHQPLGVALDANYIYWADAQTQSIGRANLDGSNVQSFLFSTGAGSLPIGVAVDAQHIYWTDQATSHESIGRANLDGSSPDPFFMFGAGPGVGIVGIAVDAEHIYWAYFPDQFSGAVGRANLDGSNANRLFITGGSGGAGVSVDAGHVYWANHGSGAIGRSNLDGSSPNQGFITGAGSPYFTAVGD